MHLSVPLKDKTKKHIALLRALFAKPSGARCILPGGLTGLRSGDGVLLFVGSSDGDAEKEESIDKGHLKIRTFPYKKGDKIPDSLYTKWVDCDKIKGTLFERRRENGDRICIAEHTTKKLQDIFVDEKIPNECRDRIPVIADEEKVVWVVGYRLSTEVYVTEKTETIMEITY